MNFDPQKFFIGLMDFLSILLPGALLTFLLMGEVGPIVLGDRYAKLADAGAWGAFLFVGYLFGHLVFLLGFWLDEFYDWARRYTLKTPLCNSTSSSSFCPIGASWGAIGADHIAHDAVRQLKDAGIPNFVSPATVLANHKRPMAEAIRRDMGDREFLELCVAKSQSRSTSPFYKVRYQHTKFPKDQIKRTSGFTELEDFQD